ncbi:hypothetical protein PLESTB_000179300 [Pleodorina starrii]|uniref:mRNA export factor GLE1 n=1 Tax=Pleodorina starrii TaxID=330485 RepID=A0A9W6BCL1_9CHLO|nr:hypothetical protein PLESTB_000179300 [Pleodorina starrii]GLC66134.1 hypothetical protein PLESTF_000388500 [Pleodorina starrii]
MSSPYSDGVVRRLNFSSDAATPLSLVATRRAPRSPAPPAPKSPVTAPQRAPSTGIVRYGLPEEELHAKERRSGGTRSVSYRVPSDDGSDSETEATSGYTAETLTKPDAVEEQRRLLEQQLLASLETIRATKQASWRSRLAEVESRLTAELSLLATSALRKLGDLQRQDEEQLRVQQRRRDEVLEKVQSSHRTEASLQEQQVKRFVMQREEEERRKEAERRREAERQEAERERKRREEEEAERKRKEEEERKRQEAEAEKQRLEADKQKKKEAEEQQQKEAAAKAMTSPGQAHPCVRVSAAAAHQSSHLAARLAEAQSAVAPLLGDEAAKKQRREIEKKLTVHVQQICGTQNQVQVKCQDVYTLLSGLQGPWRTFGMLTFCNKVIKQHELVQLNNKAAFPLSLVAVKVSSVFPDLLDLLIALIQKTCPLAIPRSYVHDPAKISNNAYYRGMGFEEQDDPSAASGKVFESPEEYIRRVEGIMLLYGAIMQVDEPNRHGVHHAWSYLARALNQLPADRFTAKALIAVLRVAGYSLHLRFRGQFVKLLSAMQREFLPALRAAAGDDIGALATLLDSYVADGLYRKPPEGRNMPAFDISSMEGNRA